VRDDLVIVGVLIMAPKHLGFSDYERLSGDLAPLASPRSKKLALALCQFS
jgi:hypothetical protein